jgi:KTSC domain
MQRERVESSGVVSVGYDDWSKILEIEYPGGAVYDYSHVPEVLYRDLLAAESKGRFINLYIKPYFQYEEVETGQPIIYASSAESPGKRYSLGSRRRRSLHRHRTARRERAHSR